MVAHLTMLTYGGNPAFDLLKAFGYIERVVKSEKTYFASYVRNMF